MISFWRFNITTLMTTEHMKVNFLEDFVEFWSSEQTRDNQREVVNPNIQKDILWLDKLLTINCFQM